ncbi:ABC transporter permease [Acetobacterium bakii]|uniref:ABC transporter permease n=1 Tax=Acetobacterium bakii TaxID=52689 RepID=UPI00068330C0|nr:ABC transporter permease [Acetobacterium bakii]
MIKYISKKILYAFLVLLGVSILTFMMGRIAPGDPVDTLLSNSQNPTLEERQEAEEYLGLNQPWTVQYFNWTADIIKGDFGNSYKTNQPVLHEFMVRLPSTLLLTCGATIVMLLIGFPLGIASALKKGKILDVGISLCNTIAISIPSFCLGILLILVFGVNLKILPVMGMGGFKHLVLPSLSIGIIAGAGLARLIRIQMLSVIKMNHVTAAKVFGVSNYRIVKNHMLKNALPPIITSIGLMIGGLLGGSAIIETLFAWPGAGGFLVDAIYGRDYPVIQAYALIMAGIYMLINILVDFIYGILIPTKWLSGDKNENKKDTVDSRDSVGLNHDRSGDICTDSGTE